jgi:hypothetical protein
MRKRRHQQVRVHGAGLQMPVQASPAAASAASPQRCRRLQVDEARRAHGPGGGLQGGRKQRRASNGGSSSTRSALAGASARQRGHAVAPAQLHRRRPAAR